MNWFRQAVATGIKRAVRAADKADVPTIKPIATSARKILFTPESDITTYELAIIMGNIGMRDSPIGVSPIFCTDKAWFDMPPGVRRHWTVKSPVTGV
jgi:hypothetical protein